MDGDEKFWVSIVGIIGAVSVILILGCTYLHNQKLKTVMVNGYEEVQGLGTSETFWKKVK